ncbi:MAG: thiamine-phosphate kinase [Bacteroidales bacterium]|jgi:thiamine-monophosphate kinase|nr:thiamine-phosphate kinase [Bacteroidales bacterium]
MIEEKKSPENSDLTKTGKSGLIKEKAAGFEKFYKNSITGVGEDASVVKLDEKYAVFSSKLFIENVHFDLGYFPLKHLGYKCVAVTLSDILAMNVIPTQLRVNIAVSNRFSKPAIDELMEGITICCKIYKIDLIGLDISSSSVGLIISMEAVGQANNKTMVNRAGAGEKELICVSGDLGAAYTGLLLLEREKQVFKAHPDNQPDLSEFDYLIERQIKPEPRFDLIDALKKEEILPTSMIHVTDGLASALMNVCKASQKGCMVYENKIPVDTLTCNTLRDLKIVATTIALNGGEDYELLFTVKQEDFEKIQHIENVSIIGYITEPEEGYMLISNDEKVIELQAQEFSGY